MIERKIDLSDAYRRYQEREVLEWNGNLNDYLEFIVDHSTVAALAHARLNNMVMSYGYEPPNEEKGEKYGHYKFLDGILFGNDQTKKALADYFEAAARRMEIRKRILMLVGPVGGGKSTLVAGLKKGLEQYTKTDEGTVIGIADCPQHENPLHLIPENDENCSMRADLENEYGIHVEGRLCPSCQLNLKEKYQDDIFQVPLQRVVFSEKGRKGIGTFTPSDPKSQDISELVGSIDLATIGEYGVESDPRAFRFDGEFNVANRGMMEFIEMLKVDKKFLFNLLTLTQEQNFKVGRFALIYADEFVVAHTNEEEFNDFIADKKNKALHDRIHMIKVPYSLRINDEVKIYEKLIREGDVKVHLDPEALRTCAMVSILSRLKKAKDQSVSLVDKMLLYNGEDLSGKDQSDARKLQEEEEARNEGMTGVSPRFIINALSAAVVDNGVTCVTPIEALRAIRAQVDHQPGYEPLRNDIDNFVALARKEYDTKAQNIVQSVLVSSFRSSAQNILEKYLDNVEAATANPPKRVQDKVTGEWVEPNEKLMRALEEQMGVSETAKKQHRENIMMDVGRAARKGEKLAWDGHPKLKEGIEKQLFAAVKPLLRILTESTTSGRKLSPEDQRSLDQAMSALQREQGYCSHCSHEVFKYVGTLINK